MVVHQSIMGMKEVKDLTSKMT